MKRRSPETSLKRLFFIALVSLVSAFVIVFFVIVRNDTSFFSANVQGENQLNEIYRVLTPFQNLIQEKNIDELQIRFFGIPGSEKFLNDFGKCGILHGIILERLSSGFWLSFECTQSDDVLHPHFGFFEGKGEKIERVFWGIPPKARILSEKITEDMKILEIQNDSFFPWSTSDTWLNFKGETVVIFSKNDSAEIKTGEIGEFVISADDNTFFFQNETNKYYLDIGK